MRVATRVFLLVTLLVALTFGQQDPTYTTIPSTPLAPGAQAQFQVSIGEFDVNEAFLVLEFTSSAIDPADVQPYLGINQPAVIGGENATLFTAEAVVQEAPGGQVAAFADSEELQGGNTFFITIVNEGTGATNINGSLYITSLHTLTVDETLSGIFNATYAIPANRRIFFRLEVPDQDNEALYFNVWSATNGANLLNPYIINQEFAVNINHLRWQADETKSNGRRIGYEAWLRRQITQGTWSASVMNTANTMIEANFTIYLADAETLGNYFAFTGYLQTLRWTLGVYTTNVPNKNGLRILTLNPPNLPNRVFVRKTFCPTFSTPSQELVHPTHVSHMLDEVQHIYVYPTEPATEYCIGIFNDEFGAPYPITISALEVNLNDPEVTGSGSSNNGDDDSTKGLAIAAIVIFSLFIALVVFATIGAAGFIFYKRMHGPGGAVYRRMTNEL